MCVLLFFCIENSLFAQTVQVPENIQAALLSKVLKFNQDLQKTANIKILVVYNKNLEINRDNFINGLDESISVKAIKPIELEKNISDYKVVYFMSGLNKEAILCKKHKVLSVTGTNQYVENGEISLGFKVENNKPRIVMNLTSLEKEEQFFSSDILRISKIFK